MEHPFLQDIHAKSRANPQKIAFPEGFDPRVLHATLRMAREGILQPILVGDPEKIGVAAKQAGLDISPIPLIDSSATSQKNKDLAYKLYELRKEKGLTFFEAQNQARHPLTLATLLLHAGEVDGVVSGSMSPTADVIRAAAQIIKTQKGISVISGSFIMASPHPELGSNGLFIFADCGVVPAPDPAQLAQIAISSAQTGKALLNLDPKIALLSFSTKGSAQHESVDKVREALKILKEIAPHLRVDGEMQLDAAVIPAIGKSKAPGSEVAGQANVLIFPDLNSGNIGYKLVERFGRAIALGPILQGINKPMNDLSRGCNADDIFNMGAITAVQAQMATQKP